MNVKWLREQLAQLSDEATVTIGINGTLFEVGGVGTENHDADRSPRVVLELGHAYRYGQVAR